MSKIVVIFLMAIMVIGMCFLAVMDVRHERLVSQKVILYSADGKEIRRWVSNGLVQCYNGHYKFFDKYSESKQKVTISGTVIVE